MNLDVITNELIASRPYFSTFTPGPTSLIKTSGGAVGRTLSLGWKFRKQYKKAKKVANEAKRGVPADEIVGRFIAQYLITRATRPVKNQVTTVAVHMSRTDHDWTRKNGIGGRGWITRPGRYKMVIVFHDANRAGPHIDVHIDRVSVVYRVKPELYSQLKYNSDGMLTEKSRDLLIDHVRQEVAGNSRVPQNIDHSKSNAVASWTGGDPEEVGYGAGRTRQVVLQTEVDVYKTDWGHPIEMYAPAINPSSSLFMYRLYEGKNTGTPILIWGTKSANPPKLEDRLHLKMKDPDDIESLRSKADMSTSTAKYDGSSCYVVITPKGTTVWSPRTSKRTGKQIEYTFKLDGVAKTHTNNETIVGMGEVLFKSKDTGEYLPSALGSGILNSNALLPEEVEPEIRLYRIDRVGRNNTKDLEFWENRKLQQDVAKLNPDRLKVVDLMDPDTAHEKGFEGIVVIPEGGSVNDGFKVKYWQDPDDWRIDKVAFYPGSKGGLAGVVECTSLESGKKFNLGPGQVGNRQLTEAMMNDPETFEGSVIKVQSRRGHEGRASTMVGFHDDKGFSPEVLENL